MPRRHHTIHSLLLISAYFVGTTGTSPAGETKDPRLARVIYAMADELIRQGKDGEALPYIEKAIAKDPDFHSSHLSAARIYEKMGDKENARKYYSRTIQILTARTDRTPEENSLLAEITKKSTGVAGKAGRADALRAVAAENLRLLATTFEKEKKDYSALVTTMKLLAILPEDKTALADRGRLTKKNGYFLSNNACNLTGWKILYNGELETSWHLYGGNWITTETAIRNKHEAEYYIFYNGPLRRNFIFRVRVRLSWGGSCALMGRADRDGTFYSAGIVMESDIDGETGKIKETNPQVTGHIYNQWQPVKTMKYDAPPEGVEITDKTNNLLEISCLGEKIVGRINHTVIFSIKDKTLESGTLGIMLKGGHKKQASSCWSIEVRDMP